MEGSLTNLTHENPTYERLGLTLLSNAAAEIPKLALLLIKVPPLVVRMPIGVGWNDWSKSAAPYIVHRLARLIIFLGWGLLLFFKP